MTTRTQRPLALASACLLILAAGGRAPGGGPAKAAKEGGAGGKAAAKQTIRLKSIDAVAAADVLRGMFRSADRKDLGLELAVEPLTNAVHLSGPAGLVAGAARVLRLLDGQETPGKAAPKAPDARQEIHVFSLRYITPDRTVEEALRPLLGMAPNHFVIDRDRKLVIAFGDRESLDKAEALLVRLDESARPLGPAVLPEFEVRLVWLAGGPAGKNAVLPGADLAAAVDEVRPLGLDKPTVVARSRVRTKADVRFEQGGQARLDEAPCQLSVTGRVLDLIHAAELEATVRVTQGGKESGQLCTLKTQVTVPLGKAVVLGVTPAHERPTAFLVEVRRVQPKPAAKPAKKAAVPVPQNAPWARVFEWLSDQTGLPVVGNDRPTGTFTLVLSGDKKYTPAELLDLVNEGLLAKNYLLLRREKSLALVVADEKIDPVLVPQVDPEELARRGRTELVSVTLPLVKTLVAEDMAREVKKLLG